MSKALLTLGGLGFLTIPVIAILTALTVTGSAVECIQTASGGVLADNAPVPTQARAWIAETAAACPDLPEAWIAAVMDQESGFRPDAHADDSNGGTWGLFQLNASIWTATYAHPWSADLDGDGIWDVKDPLIHARVAGQYLCSRLDGVRAIRAAHPDWASSRLPVLDALIIAHNAGEDRLRTYPTIPAITAAFLTHVHDRVAAWSAPSEAGAQAEPVDPGTASSVPAAAGGASAPRSSGGGCVPGLGTGASAVVVPPDTPADVATAVRTALSYVGVRSGWRQLCDKLACRAYGYVGSGFVSATAHWAQMVVTGHAHPGDTCPPLGSFVFWDTGRPFGHVSVVVHADPGCDPAKTLVTANEVFDSATGNRGGVYLLSFAQLNAGYVNGRGYLGWSDPVCAGAHLPASTVPPPPSGS